MHESRLLSVSEVARRLSISTRSVQLLIERGHLTIIRPTARRVAIGETDVGRFIEARRAERLADGSERDV